MKWVLVYIALTHHGHPIVEEKGRFEQMTDCFLAREALAEEMGGSNGYFLDGEQAVCVSHKVADKY